MNAISAILVLTLTVSVVCGMTFSTRDNVDRILARRSNMIISPDRHAKGLINLNIRKRDEIMDNLNGVPGADVVSGRVLQKRDEIVDNLNGVPGSDIVKRSPSSECWKQQGVGERYLNKTCDEIKKEDAEWEKKNKTLSSSTTISGKCPHC